MKKDIAGRFLLSAVLARPLELGPGSRVRIGRDPAADIRLPGQLASRDHAEILPVIGSFVVIDKESANGTFVNGERVKRQILRDGDRIGIAQFQIRYREVGAEERRELLTGHSLPSTEADRDAAEERIRGEVKEISLLELAQFLHCNQRTGVLRVGDEHRLHFVEGELVHAESGAAAGEAAVRPILALREGTFIFFPAWGLSKKTIATPTQALLLRAVQERPGGLDANSPGMPGM